MVNPSSEAVELKACPFCGSTNVSIEDDGHYEWLQCNNCKARGPWIEPPEGHHFTGTEMHDQWNTRSLPQNTGVTGDAAEEEAYELGKRDGYEGAVQDIDLMTGGDGEYFASTIPGRGCPDAATMKARIAERFASLSQDIDLGQVKEALEPFALLAERPTVNMDDPLRKWLTVAQLVTARQALSLLSSVKGGGE